MHAIIVILALALIAALVLYTTQRWELSALRNHKVTLNQTIDDLRQQARDIRKQAAVRLAKEVKLAKACGRKEVLRTRQARIEDLETQVTLLREMANKHRNRANSLAGAQTRRANTLSATLGTTSVIIAEGRQTIAHLHSPGTDKARIATTEKLLGLKGKLKWEDS